MAAVLVVLFRDAVEVLTVVVIMFVELALLAAKALVVAKFKLVASAALLELPMAGFAGRMLPGSRCTPPGGFWKLGEW